MNKVNVFLYPFNDNATFLHLIFSNSNKNNLEMYG